MSPARIDDDTSSTHLQKAKGWDGKYNPDVPLHLKVDLFHTLKHSSVVCCVCISPNSEYIASGCHKAAMVWRVSTGSLVAILEDEFVDERNDVYVRSIVFSPDSNLLVVGNEQGQIRIWDILNLKVMRSLKGHTGPIFALDFALNGEYIVSGSGDCTSRIWRALDGECISVLSDIMSKDEDTRVSSVAISFDSKWVATGSLDSLIRMYSVPFGILVDRFEGHMDSIYSVAFRPDGQQVASASLDTEIRLWDLPDYSKPSKGAALCSMVFEGHTSFVLSVTYSSDGQYLVSGSKDCDIRIWDIKTGTSLLVLQGHQDSVLSVRMSMNGKYLVSGAGDRLVRIWNYTLLDTFTNNNNHQGSVTESISCSTSSLTSFLSSVLPSLPLTSSNEGDSEVNYMKVKDPTHFKCELQSESIVQDANSSLKNSKLTSCATTNTESGLSTKAKLTSNAEMKTFSSSSSSATTNSINPHFIDFFLSRVLDFLILGLLLILLYSLLPFFRYLLKFLF